MAKRKRRNVEGAKQFNYEIDGELVDRFRAFCRGRGETVVAHLEIALKRHLANPPGPLTPPDPPPLPPVPAPAPAKNRGRPPEPKGGAE